MKKAILFTNYSNEDFAHAWDSTEYNFPKGQSMMLEGPLCFHFARHLAIRELNRNDVITSRANIATEMNKAMSNVEIEAADSTKLAQDTLNYNEMKKDELVAEAEKKGIDVKNDDGKAKKRDELVDDLEGFEGE